MTIVIPGETLDCTNPKLQLFLSIGGIGTDPFILEYQIFEDVTTPGAPIQVYPLPAGTRATVDIANLCPTGDKISVGNFLAQWPLVPIAEPLGNHIVKWYFKLLSTSAEQEECVGFSVLALAASPGDADIAAFKARFPLLADRGDTVIGLAIEEAKRCINVSCFGDKAPDAQNLLAAHMVEMTTNAGLASGAQSVTAGMAAIVYKTLVNDPRGLDKTMYGQLFARLMFVSGPAAQVLC